MITLQVESETLAALAYDAARQFLQIQFRDHTIYCYFDVPTDIFQALTQAPSKGRYFNKSIRPRFRYEKLHSFLS